MVACVRESAMREGVDGGGLVMSVQQGEVVGEDHVLHRPKPKDWHRN